ncbi:MAG: PIG-L family deacetylase [Acidimicrobiia bacterium]|nr:PIG-L family deacetylase [Acidimicrobiia bacterium]
MPGLTNPGAEIYVPDGIGPDEALSRTTHLAVGAHPDDIPIMALDGVARCFGNSAQWFTGVTVADGAGSPRAGRYADLTDEQMREVRMLEEKEAAAVGEYGAAVLLDYRSSAVKDPSRLDVVSDLAALIEHARPGVVYTHNLADKHDTHVAAALRTVAAIRSLPAGARPAALYGCEVWRDLDWVVDEDKVVFDVTGHEGLAAALLGAYDSQISGGKRYDEATAGRRLANATFSETHAVGTATALIYAMDLTPLVVSDTLQAEVHVAAQIERMHREVRDRIGRLQ